MEGRMRRGCSWCCQLDLGREVQARWNGRIQRELGRYSRCWQFQKSLFLAHWLHSLVTEDQTNMFMTPRAESCKTFCQSRQSRQSCQPRISALGIPRQSWQGSLPPPQSPFPRLLPRHRSLTIMSPCCAMRLFSSPKYVDECRIDARGGGAAVYQAGEGVAVHCHSGQSHMTGSPHTSHYWGTRQITKTASSTALWA